jgi:hypothetical protein
MLMIDGEQSVNGRDAASVQAAIRRALARKPAVAIDVDVALEPDGLPGAATIMVTSRSPRAEKIPLLGCAVLREDGVVTHVTSGENAGKSLVALPDPSGEIRVHRARRQVAGDTTVPARRRSELE